MKGTAANVKSAERVLDIITVMAEQDEPIRLIDVARRLDIPMSSATALLGTAVQRGFVRRIGKSRYQLNRGRLSQMASRRDRLLDDAVNCARVLNRELGIGAVVAHRAGLNMEWDFTVGLNNLAVGSSLPLFETICGLAVIRQLDDGKITDLIDRYNSKFGRSASIQARDVLDKIRPWRNSDHFCGRPPRFPNLSNISVVLRGDDNQELILTSIMQAGAVSTLEAPIMARIRSVFGESLQRQAA